MRASCLLCLSTAAWSFACVARPPTEQGGGADEASDHSGIDGQDRAPDTGADATIADTPPDARSDDAGDAPVRDVLPFDPDSPDPCGGPFICAETRDQWWEYCTDPISEEHCGTSHLARFVPPPSNFCLTWWPEAGETSAFFIELRWGEGVSFLCVGHCIPGNRTYLFAIDAATGIVFDGILWNDAWPDLPPECLLHMGDPLPWSYEPWPPPGTRTETTYWGEAVPYQWITFPELDIGYWLPDIDWPGYYGYSVGWSDPGHPWYGGPYLPEIVFPWRLSTGEMLPAVGVELF